MCLLLLCAALGLASCGGGEGSGEPARTSQESSDGGGDRETAEQSVEGFGIEAASAEREAILSTRRDYLLALAREDYGSACSYLVDQVLASLRRLVVERLRAGGCKAILPKVLSRSASATMRQLANGKVTKVRVAGSQAFVIFRAPGAKLYVLPMQQQAGEWKATTVVPSILVPELS